MVKEKVVQIKFNEQETKEFVKLCQEQCRTGTQMAKYCVMRYMEMIRMQQEQPPQQNAE